jgi:hypothetical protein
MPVRGVPLRGEPGNCGYSRAQKSRAEAGGRRGETPQPGKPPVSRVFGFLLLTHTRLVKLMLPHSERKASGFREKVT